ncbi:MAG: hypothetical protein HKN33_07030 [Pyrinomonadaceae bacterium]|nr:hypothetical protein [Pyrinomonadaceae bacterium]
MTRPTVFLRKIFVFALLLVFASAASAQEGPLSLADIMTGLNAASSGMTKSQLNTYIKQRVEKRGVTFTLSSVIQQELVRAGAGPSLIAAIRANGPTASQTSTTKSTTKAPSIKFDKVWVEKNQTKSGRKGMIVHAKYTAYNLLNTPLQLTVRVQDAKKQMIKSANKSFANKSGQFALYKNFKPGFDAAVYKDWSVFLPYGELNLSPGTHSLKLDVDIIYPDGKILQHLVMYPTSVVIPKPSLRPPKGIFDKMWVDYGVRQSGELGMRVHTKIRVRNLKDQLCYLKISFTKDNGEVLKAGNTLFADGNGGVALFKELTPGYAATVYSDLSVFLPYKELNLPKGKYNLKMHADLTYPDGGVITHLNYYRFTYTKR